MSATTRQLPLFPLNLVLFPGGPLPLRIFETRYVDMVRRCLREESGFGVVCITEGPEAAGKTSFHAVGTEAKIIDFNRLEDGLLGITCLGQRRFRVLEAWRAEDGLNLGRVEEIAPEPNLAVPPEFAFVADAARKILPELGDLYAQVRPAYDDAAWVGYRLAEVLPISLADKQALLEMDDPLARLAAFAPVIRKPD
ncbi:MAG: LON peptidase substrate-binding domain-containing protein [Steroidobacteraceae bacterium]